MSNIRILGLWLKSCYSRTATRGCCKKREYFGPDKHKRFDNQNALARTSRALKITRGLDRTGNREEA